MLLEFKKIAALGIKQIESAREAQKDFIRAKSLKRMKRCLHESWDTLTEWFTCLGRNIGRIRMESSC